jgi:hypothetical protein
MVALSTAEFLPPSSIAVAQAGPSVNIDAAPPNAMRHAAVRASLANIPDSMESLRMYNLLHRHRTGQRAFRNGAQQGPSSSH